MGLQYAQTLVLVTSLHLMLLSYLVIARSHEVRFGRTLVEIKAPGLPSVRNWAHTVAGYHGEQRPSQHMSLGARP